MFEDLQKIGSSDTRKRLMSSVVAIALEGALALAVVVIPLIFYSSLSEGGDFLTFLIAPPDTPPAEYPTAPAAAAAGSGPSRPSAPPKLEPIVTSDPNATPLEIPKDIPAPMGESPVIGLSSSSGVGGGPGGVPGGSPYGVIGGSVIGGLLPIKAPPLAPPPLPPKPAAPPTPKPQVEKPIGVDVLQAQLKVRVDPVYPELAKRARVSGTVVLLVNVDEEGNVSNIKVSSGNALLKDAAVSAVRQWKYSPTLLNGEPVPVVGTVTVNFILR